MDAEVPAGWYPDAEGHPCERYWDGEKWTHQTRPLSVLPQRDPPQMSKPKVGLDSNERTILLVIAALFLVIVLFGS